MQRNNTENKFCDGNCPCNSDPKEEMKKEFFNELDNLYSEFIMAVNHITDREEHWRDYGFFKLGHCTAMFNHLIEIKDKLD